MILFVNRYVKRNCSFRFWQKKFGPDLVGKTINRKAGHEGNWKGEVLHFGNALQEESSQQLAVVKLKFLKRAEK